MRTKKIMFGLMLIFLIYIISGCGNSDRQELLEKKYLEETDNVMSDFNYHSSKFDGEIMKILNNGITTNSLTNIFDILEELSGNFLILYEDIKPSKDKRKVHKELKDIIAQQLASYTEIFLTVSKRNEITSEQIKENVEISKATEMILEKIGLDKMGLEIKYEKKLFFDPVELIKEGKFEEAIIFLERGEKENYTSRNLYFYSIARLLWDEDTEASLSAYSLIDPYYSGPLSEEIYNFGNGQNPGGYNRFDGPEIE